MNTDWLQGWDNRVKVDIQPSKKLVGVRNMPILIKVPNYISKNGEPSVVVATEDGTPLEIEDKEWDAGHSQLYLWVIVPLLRKQGTLYLYYNKLENILKIGGKGE